MTITQKWRDDGFSPNEFTTVGTLLIKAEDVIQESDPRITIRHVLVFRGGRDVKGFVVNVRDVGSGGNSDVYYGEGLDAYLKALEEGNEMVRKREEKYAQWRREYNIPEQSLGKSRASGAMWRDDGLFPNEIATVSRFAIRGEDVILGSDPHFTIKHAVAFRGGRDVKGFVAGVWDEGSGGNGEFHAGETFEAYFKALKEGEDMVARRREQYEQWEREYQEALTKRNSSIL